MNICVIGTGYVGLVTGTCLADFGHNVICADIDKVKIDKLNNGIIPIYEPGLDLYINRNIEQERLSFVADIPQAIKSSDIIFIAVGTPSADDGSVNMDFVFSVAGEIGKNINSYKVIVTKSTVPVGTGKKIKDLINTQTNGEHEFDIVSNPEFLREGKAVYDFTHPDRVVIGTESEKAKKIMKDVYRALYLLETPFVFTNIETAEMIKYAANTFLAMKITFINEIANLCEKTGANVQDVAKAIGKDGRIGSKFLHAGPGYGGSCFPKDTRAMVSIGNDYGVDMTLVKQTISANEKQKHLSSKKIIEALGGVKGKKIAILGLTFKPETDDVRGAPSLTIIRDLVKEGAQIRAYCPKGIERSKVDLMDIKDHITYCKNAYEAAKGSNCIAIITEWHEFRNLDLNRLGKLLTEKSLFDLRNIYEVEYVKGFGFKYYGTGQ